MKTFLMKSAGSILMPFVFLFFMSGCTGHPPGVAYDKDGKEYGKVRGAFRNQWWNFYERGISYADGQFYAEALADLTTAVGLRDNDQRMARTYGMHFIDYLPHRELGVIHYLMGSLEAAKTELELSISQFPSAKAHFYLDRVRKALLEQEGKAATPPRVTLLVDGDIIWTRQDPVVIEGVAEDEDYVAAVSVNDRTLFLEGAQKRFPFKESLSLSQGEHVVMVEARNLHGKTSTRRVVVHVDREGPMFSLNKVENAPEGTITISGSVYDNAGVSELIINGKPSVVKTDIEVPFTLSLDAQNGEIGLVARDRLGNETAAMLLIDLTIAAKPLFRLAYAGSEQDPTIAAANFLPKNNNPPEIAAANFRQKNNHPSDIELKGWTESQTVFMEKAYIEGKITGESQIVYLSINNIPVLHRKGQVIFFNHLAELRKGENSIKIEARDEAGNTTIKKISILRQIPMALELDERLSLTILPFEQKGSVSEVSSSFQDNLINSLVDQKRFRIVERSRLDAVLEEQKLSQTQLVDKSTALQLGKLVAAKSIITGSIIETNDGIEFVARMIDTETSELLATEDVYNELKDIATLRSLAEGMAIKFHREFPLVDGSVIQQERRYILTDLGKDKVTIQRRLIVYREKPIKHPQTGKILGSDNTIIAHARVTQVMPEMSKADLLNGENFSIDPMDKVITE